MACQHIDHSHIDLERDRLERAPIYAPGSEGRASVQFHFQLAPETLGNSLFVIYSARMRTAVYRGLYRSSVTVEIDKNLSADKYYDNVRFLLLRSDPGQRCTWNNERGEQYWRPWADIRIQLLDETILDKDSLTKEFNVSIR